MVSSRHVFPLTPGSSSDIKGQDGTSKLALLQLPDLPPPAVNERLSPTFVSASSSSSISSPDATCLPRLDHHHHQRQPPQQHQVFPPTPSDRSWSSGPPRLSISSTQLGEVQDDEEEFSLPPPPAKVRKIIQMTPGEKADTATRTTTTTKSRTSTRRTNSRSTDSASRKRAAPTNTEANDSSQHAHTQRDFLTGPTNATASKKRKATKTKSAAAIEATPGPAGNKSARKTAHSLIERRRRSKMNEEFAVLRGLVPACTEDMHKLTILQASIEYVRYLHDCVDRLKEQQQKQQQKQQQQQQFPPQPEPLPPIRELHPFFREADDADMVPSASRVPRSEHRSQLSDVDKEATAALLMLNSGKQSRERKGMSVSDLLLT